MAKHMSNGAEQGEDQDDRRMNAYMAGMQSTPDDSEEEGEEVAPRRRKGRQARRMDYSV